MSVDASGDKRTPAVRRDDEPVLPNTSGDNGDVGWGDDPQSARRDKDWYRGERPPHHE